MRTITTKTVEAFLNNKNFKSGHDQVLNGQMSYRGNVIATNDNGKISIDTCGWNTNTTRERLNGIPGVNVSTRKGQLFLNGNPWDGSLIEI